MSAADSLEFLLRRSIQLAQERKDARGTTNAVGLYEQPARLPHETAHGRTMAKLDLLGELARGYAHGCVRLKELGDAAVEYTAALIEERA